MSLTPYLNGLEVDPETKRVLSAALEMTCVSLALTDNFANEIIAKQISQIAETGERDPDLLCEAALKNLRGHFVRRLTRGSSNRAGSARLQMGRLAQFGPEGGGAASALAVLRLRIVLSSVKNSKAIEWAG